MTQFYDDGRVGLSFEPHGGTIRLLDAPAADGKPAYIASGHLARMSATVARLSGFHGALSIRHQALIARVLREMGYRVLYVERSHGALPLGEPIAEGDFAGWHRLDLDLAAARAARRR